jgi:hypothetical protein
MRIRRSSESMKNRRLVTFILLAIPLVGAVAALFLYSKDISEAGCPELNRHLTDDENVISAINQLVVYDRPAEAFDTTGVIYRIDNYRSSELFLREFSDCCEVYKGGPEDFFTPITWWEKFTGSAASVVKLRYRQTVRHKDGRIEVRPVLRYEILDACGKVVTSRRD